MQISKPEWNDFDQLITRALTADYKNIQFPEHVWQRIAKRVQDQHGAIDCRKHEKTRSLGIVAQFCAHVFLERISL